MGFRAPVATWLKGDLGKWGKSITLDGPIVDVLDVSEMERIWTLHDRNMGDHSYKLFALMSLASWMHDKNPSLK
jgi:hypothetical protein